MLPLYNISLYALSSTFSKTHSLLYRQYSFSAELEHFMKKRCWIYYGSPKIQMIVALSLISLTALINNFSFNLVIFILLTVSSAVFSDLLFARIRKIPISLPTAALVSGLIIVLLANPNSVWYEPVIIAIISMASKNWLRISNHHIFNPAAFGLFAGSILFSNAITWWGVSFQQLTIGNLQLTIYFLVLLSPLIISALRMKRYRTPLSFLLTYLVFSKIINPSSLIIYPFVDPALIFFISVILPEPMTSPNRHNRQIIFGIVAAVLSFAVLNSFDPLILSVLLANLIFFRLK